MGDHERYHFIFLSENHALGSIKLENFNSEKILIHLDGREMNPTLSKMTFGLGLVMVQELVRGHVGLILQ